MQTVIEKNPKINIGFYKRNGLRVSQIEFKDMQFLIASRHATEEVKEACRYWLDIAGIDHKRKGFGF